MPRDVFEAIGEIVGPRGVVPVDEAARYEVDYRGVYRGRSACVIRPASTEEVSRCVAILHEHRIPIVPQGGNTSMVGGSVPDDSGASVVLSLERMTRIRAVDPCEGMLTAEAGITLSALRESARSRNRLLPMRIGSEGSCQLGGLVSTNAGGINVLRYGTMRDLVLGLEVVLPDGRVWDGLRGLRKDNTGYDLKQLFIGAEGTLGIVTAASVKLYPLPRSTATAFVAIRDLQAALELLSIATEESGSMVAACELMSAESLRLVSRHVGHPALPLPLDGPWFLLLELAGTLDASSMQPVLERILERGYESNLLDDAAIAMNESQRSDFWAVREGISDAQTRTGGSIRFDVSVPLSRIWRFVDQATDAVRAIRPNARLVVYGHVGDGNVHFNPLRADTESTEAFLADKERVVAAVDAVVNDCGGSISAEHGIGIEKLDSVASNRRPIDHELMRLVKSAIDPLELMNPGKLLPRAPLIQARE